MGIRIKYEEEIPRTLHLRCLKCRDISSIYWVSGHPKTILAHDNRLEEKSDKIVNISIRKRITDNFDGNQRVEQHVCQC